MRKGNIFRKPAFNIIVTLLLIALLAFFYKYAMQNYTERLEKDLETLDTERLSQIEAMPKTIDEVLDIIGNPKSDKPIDKILLEYCKDNIKETIYDDIFNYLKTNNYSDDMWEKLCGYTLRALYDLANGIADEYNYIVEDTVDSLTLAFAGDVSLDTKWNWSPLYVHSNNRENLLEAAFSENLSQRMLDADLFCLNLESPFVSEGGRAIDNFWRHYSAPENADILSILGADLVNIANDRIYDYSAKGLGDTINALQDTDIMYVGAGEDLEDATLPRYLIAGGRKIAIVASTAPTTAPEATENSEGLIYSSKSKHFISMIKKAEENADYVIVYIDWGNGNNERADDAQKNLAYSFINSGADIVIGCRSMVMQSIEYYKGKPIIYGLGNFWYETDVHNTIFLEIKFSREEILPEDENSKKSTVTYVMEEEPMVYCLPCVQRGAVTTLVHGTDAGNAIVNRLVQISDNNISIDENGLLSEVE